ncbi:tRNA threonylcarbamoyladenosine dehydratase [Candidatus Fermentibacteria bacterium]|nr:MAG: tRNA threonylcarbamoyladenosine dehydratase [Candidatus Fermentibacteria bacterium]
MNRFKRVKDFYGEEGFESIRNSTVYVAGAGGVGSHCAQALARSGIGKLYLADFDAVTQSSLNRSTLWTPEDAGKNKAESLAQYLKKSCPDTTCVPILSFISGEYLEEKGIPAGTDIVADAIDSVNPKTHLLQYCIETSIPVFSSMGAAGRRDVSCIRTGDIQATGGCPLARMIRKYLRRRGINSGVTCVWSVEKAVDPLPPDDEPRLDRRGRTRNSLPSLITMPGIFGYTLAQLILDHIAQQS